MKTSGSLNQEAKKMSSGLLPCMSNTCVVLESTPPTVREKNALEKKIETLRKNREFICSCILKEKSPCQRMRKPKVPNQNTARRRRNGAMALETARHQ